MKLPAIFQDRVTGACRPGKVYRDPDGRMHDVYGAPYETVGTVEIEGHGEYDGPATVMHVAGSGFVALVPERGEL